MAEKLDGKLPPTSATTKVSAIPFSKAAAEQAEGALILHNAQKKAQEKAPTVPILHKKEGKSPS